MNTESRSAASTFGLADDPPDEVKVAEPWYARWPARPPTDAEACPTCGYGLDDGSGTEHECPPGFRDA